MVYCMRWYVDTVFSYAEPGFEEVRTSAYITAILERNGFKIKRGVAGIPTAWTATWGDGGPLVAIGSDEDDLRGLSQIPGSPTIKPLVEGAPGHGEGHNSGVPLMVAAALATKAVMEKNHLPGRLMVWPGIAEELFGAKAYYVRKGVFDGVDVCIVAHVGPFFGTFWGRDGRSAAAAALATDTTVTHRLLGTAAPGFGNRPMAEATYENIKAVGMPKWSNADQTFAKQVQMNNHLAPEPLFSSVLPLRAPSDANLGVSDDIGDVAWTVPTITITRPTFPMF